MRDFLANLVWIFRLWFGVTLPVSPAAYVLTGLPLIVAKYLGEALVAYSVTGEWLMPWEFLSPFGWERLDVLQIAPEWVGPMFFVWTAPFLWIALSMSVRRAVDLGASPWWGLCVLIPFLNLIVILILSSPYRSQQPEAIENPTPPRHPYVWDLSALLFGPIYTLLMVGTVIYVLEDYGVVLFFGTPVIIGAVCAFLGLRSHPNQPAHAFALTFASLVASGLTLMLLALEGAVCLAMAAPLALGGGMIGAGIGIVICRAAESGGSDRGGFGALLLLPCLGALESRVAPPSIRPITTAVVIDAPPEVVWRQVISFPKLTEKPAWYFRAGIAYPTGATISGHGPGAVRRCRFSTGDFIEPITTWDEPRRLAFDVASQPEPMAEVNPFGDPHPPHLETALVSKRGEFRLEPLPGGRTRLVGTTWYRLRMRPHAYWRMWTDAVIRRIHLRVLRHIERLTESDRRERMDRQAVPLADQAD